MVCITFIGGIRSMCIGWRMGVIWSCLGVRFWEAISSLCPTIPIPTLALSLHGLALHNQVLAFQRVVTLFGQI